MIILLAQKIKLPDGTIIDGPLPNKPEFQNLGSVVSYALPLIFSIAGLLLFAYLVWGGLSYLLSMGDSKKAEAARAKITSALIGFLIIFAAYWLTQIVSYLFKL